jgi:DNA-directed RNA polymerase II subunit RPB7
MFFLKAMERVVTLPPQFFGPALRETLERKLVDEVEGTCSGRFGYVVLVQDVSDIGQGRIQDGASGGATFSVKYTCLAFKPFKGEVLDAVVTQVNKMGFFAEAGPLQIFVSNHHIPDDFSFQTSAGPMYCSEDGEVRVQKDCEVRLRVIGTRVDAAEIFALGSMKEDYLGVTADPSS